MSIGMFDDVNVIIRYNKCGDADIYMTWHDALAFLLACSDTRDCHDIIDAAVYDAETEECIASVCVDESDRLDVVFHY